MQRYLSEFLGTYFLVFIGTGAVVVNNVSDGSIGHLGIATAFGLVVTAMIYAFGEKSGAHINPAVTLSFFYLKRFPKKHVLPYLASQFLGAIAASATLFFAFPTAGTLGETMPTQGIIQSLVFEFILSYFLMLVILKVSTGSKETGMMAGLAIGVTVGMEA